VIKWIFGRGSSRSTGAGATLDREFVALTDIGLKRDENQDAVLAVRLPLGRILLAVADGVGGSADGAAASQTALACLEEVMRDAHHEETGLLDAYALAHEEVGRLGTGERPPATTLVSALVHGTRAWIANIGDSRAYLADGKTLRQLTQDHSWVADQVRAGRMTEEEARTSAMRNVITRAIGSADAPPPDVTGPLVLTRGDTLMLSSDGLHGLVNDRDILDILAGDSLEGAGQELIQRAREAGGPDNISVVLYRPS
jgi:protein phosphatase